MNAALIWREKVNIIYMKHRIRYQYTWMFSYNYNNNNNNNFVIIIIKIIIIIIRFLHRHSYNNIIYNRAKAGWMCFQTRGPIALNS